MYWAVWTTDVVEEAARVLKPGGVLAITDNNPQSAVIQRLPPVIFALMKSSVRARQIDVTHV